MVDDLKTTQGAGVLAISTRVRTVLILWPCLMTVLLAASVGLAKASSIPGVQEFAVNASDSQAGGHPNVAIHIKVNAFEASDEAGLGGKCGDSCLIPATFETHFPTGFIGNPHVARRCTLTAFAQGSCPSDAQVGVFEVGANIQLHTHLVVPIYNMETRPDQAGLVGLTVPLLGAPVFLELTGRTNSDYGLDSISSPLLPLPIKEVHAYLWGVPADASHDPLRFVTPLQGIGACVEETFDPSPPFGEFPNCKTPENAGLGIGTTIPARPFLQNPTVCGVPFSSSLDVRYYNHKTAHADAPFPSATGCQQLAFNPSQTTKPTTTRADTASGVDVDLKVPQTQSPTTPSPSEIRINRVTLPKGFSINPGAADGKLACTDAETSIGTLFAAACPEFAKVGTALLDDAALPAPIPGAIYLGQPKAGERYRLILTGDGFATHVKLAGSVRPDPGTGQLTVAFEQPQTPIQEVNLHFFGSERGLLATPARCGTFAVDNEFVPWASELATRHSTSFITIDSGPNGTPCPSGPRPFAPGLQAGTANNTAGAHAPFSLALNREDGEQNLTGLALKTPPGFTATLKGIPYCPEAAIAAVSVGGYSGLGEQASPSCPAASLIGSAVAGAGAGSHPLYVPGKVYLAGPYKSAPLSLVVVIPAVSGPYDLGNVAVRAALHVDQATAQVTAVSDSLPQILEGIPLRTRFIQVNLDRPGFALNPTNCDPFAVNATVSGDEGALSSASSRFQVANCADLPFAPRLSLSLKGGTKRTGHPALTATVSYPKGGRYANIKTAQVTLPHSEFLDTAHINAPCTRVQFTASACPPLSQVGTARVQTPLLDEPLEGPVYLRSSSHNLPDLVVDLRGRFHVVLVGRVDTVKERTRTTFGEVPDIPVSAFSLSLFGGKKGLLVNSENLCAEPRKALVKIGGQNGRSVNRNTTVRTSCGKKKTRHKRSQRKHDRRHSSARRAVR